MSILTSCLNTEFTIYRYPDNESNCDASKRTENLSIFEQENMEFQSVVSTLEDLDKLLGGTSLDRFKKIGAMILDDKITESELIDYLDRDGSKLLDKNDFKIDHLRSEKAVLIRCYVSRLNRYFGLHGSDFTKYTSPEIASFLNSEIQNPIYSMDDGDNNPDTTYDLHGLSNKIIFSPHRHMAYFTTKLFIGDPLSMTSEEFWENIKQNDFEYFESSYRDYSQEDFDR